MEPILLLLLAAWLTKVITQYRVDREYAKQGLTSPRIEAKLAAYRAGQRATEPARPGAKGYFRELWHDAWEDMTDRHHRIREAKKAGEHPTLRQRWAGWRRWASRPIGERRDLGDPERPRPLPDPPVQPAPSPAPPGRPAPTRGTDPATDLPPGTWTVGADGTRVPLAAPVDPPGTTPQANQPPAAPVAGPDQHVRPPTNQPTGDDSMTTPTTAPAAEEVTTNEALRTNLDQMAQGAAELADALAAAEAARAKILAAAEASGDGVDAKKFDATATTAVHDIRDGISTATLTEWSGFADSVHASATAGRTALDQYRDSEAQVAETGIDGSVLNPTAA